VPKPDVYRKREVPMAATVLSRGTPMSGNPIRKIGVSMAAPLIPLNMAILATMIQTGSINQ